MGIPEQDACHDVGQYEGHETGKQTKEKELSGVALHTLQIHFETCQEHDVVETHTAEDLKGDVSLEDIETVLADNDARQHHADDVRDT